MSQTIGNNYPVKIPSLSDDASIVEAFEYYHNGATDGTSPESMEQHLSDVNGRVDTVDLQIGYNGISPEPLSVNTRLSSLETAVGSNLASTYIKAIPSSNTTTATRNLIKPATNSIIPLAIEGVSGQTANLQEWRIDATTIRARIDQLGRVYSWDGSSTAEVVTLTGGQTLTNKTLTNPISTIGKIVKTATYELSSATDQSKMIEVNSSSAVNIRVPLDSDANGAFPIGTYIVIMQTGAGQVTIDPKVGVGQFVTVNATPGLKTRTQWSMATLIKRDTNLWVAVGDLIA